jgi:disulfide bond formation protein DsbB
MTTRNADAARAYRLGAAALMGAIAIILAALGFEHIGHFVPCELCLMQRWAYYAAIPLLFVALVVLSAEHPTSASVLFLLVALAFLANAGLGVYQAGAEWKLWAGPATCTGAQSLSTSAGSLLNDLARTQVIRCDEPQLRIFGLSFAGWNVLISMLLFGLSLNAASRSGSAA